MKQILIPLCLLAMTAVGVQAQVKATKGVVVGSSNSVVYALPRTTLKVIVVVEKESIRKGPYARYAQKYLGVMAPLADKDIYTIVGGKIGYAQEADPNEVYTLEIPTKVRCSFILLRLRDFWRHLWMGQRRCHRPLNLLHP